MDGTGSSSAAAINASGQVVGYSTDYYTGATLVAETHAFLWENGVMHDLYLGGDSPFHLDSHAFGINSSSQIVGDMLGGTAFLRQPGGLTIQLGTLGGTSSGARGINASGQVVGWAELTGNTAQHAFPWQNGRMTDLGTLSGTYSTAYGINKSAQVVGSADLTGNTATHAFVWQQKGGMTDLNTELPAGSGWVLTTASGINDGGQIVGSGTINGQTHAFLLTPSATTKQATRIVVSSFSSSTAAGVPFSITVTAVDASGNTATGYTGSVHFTSKDRTATLPADYTFTAADQGVHTFSGLILWKAGKQTITVTDTLTSALTGSVIEDVL